MAKCYLELEDAVNEDGESFIRMSVKIDNPEGGEPTEAEKVLAVLVSAVAGGAQSIGGDTEALNNLINLPKNNIN